MCAKVVPDRLIAEIAARQHGIITAGQLEACLNPESVRRRVRAGRLHRVHRGIYAVGHTKISDRGRWLAAVLACGNRAVLSHVAAAALWGLLPPASGLVDVTVPGFGVEDPGGAASACIAPAP